MERMRDSPARVAVHFGGSSAGSCRAKLRLVDILGYFLLCLQEREVEMPARLAHCCSISIIDPETLVHLPTPHFPPPTSFSDRLLNHLCGAVRLFSKPQSTCIFFLFSFLSK
jgi:hypothetical protein